MKFCVRCQAPRQDGSFFDDSEHPSDVCKPCIYRPSRKCVQAKVRAVKSRPQRAQKALWALVKQLQPVEQSFVYLLKVRGAVKIGFSKDVNKRIRQLSTGTAQTIELIGVAPGGLPLEQELHTRFARLRISGEWFHYHKPTIIPIFAALPNALVFLPGYMTVDSTSLPTVVGGSTDS